MLHVSTPPFRRQRGRAKARPSPGPVALTLVAASYDADGPNVDLQFDRDIDIAAINPAAITVDDGQIFAQTLGGIAAGAILVAPTTVRVPLAVIGESLTADIVLSATSASGIVATDDGGMWAGVSDVVLPFP